MKYINRNSVIRVRMCVLEANRRRGQFVRLAFPFSVGTRYLGSYKPEARGAFAAGAWWDGLTVQRSAGCGRPVTSAVGLTSWVTQKTLPAGLGTRGNTAECHLDWAGSDLKLCWNRVEKRQ